jgi:hypothetical protein
VGEVLLMLLDEFADGQGKHLGERAKCLYIIGKMVALKTDLENRSSREADVCRRLMVPLLGLIIKTIHFLARVHRS